MNISLRRLLFAFFVAVFLVSAPLVVLHTAGYRLNISNRKLLQTGVLAVTTTPRGASISLNNQLLAQKTPYVLQRLMMNEYRVKLEKAGYHSWEQRIRVDEGKTSYITVRLFADSSPIATSPNEAERARNIEEQRRNDPLNSPITLLDNGANIEVRTSAAPNATLIGLLPRDAYKILQDDEEYVLVSNERGISFMIARAGGKVVEIPTHLAVYDWLDDENMLVVSDGNEIITYNAATEQTTFITRQSEGVIDVAWHPSSDTIFVATQTTISAFDINVYETRPTVVLIENTPMSNIWVDAQGKTIYFDQPLSETDPQPPLLKLPLVI